MARPIGAGLARSGAIDGLSGRELTRVGVEIAEHEIRRIKHVSIAHGRGGSRATLEVIGALHLTLIEAAVRLALFARCGAGASVTAITNIVCLTGNTVVPPFLHAVTCLTNKPNGSTVEGLLIGHLTGPRGRFAIRIRRSVCHRPITKGWCHVLATLEICSAWRVTSHLGANGLDLES